MDWTFRAGEKNKNGLTWPEWYRQAIGAYDYAVECEWSPVLTHLEKSFISWRNGVSPKDYKK